MLRLTLVSLAVRTSATVLCNPHLEAWSASTTDPAALLYSARAWGDELHLLQTQVQLRSKDSALVPPKVMAAARGAREVEASAAAQQRQPPLSAIADSAANARGPGDTDHMANKTSIAPKEASALTLATRQELNASEVRLQDNRRQHAVPLLPLDGSLRKHCGGPKQLPCGDVSDVAPVADQAVSAAQQGQPSVVDIAESSSMKRGSGGVGNVDRAAGVAQKQNVAARGWLNTIEAGLPVAQGPHVSPQDCKDSTQVPCAAVGNLVAVMDDPAAAIPNKNLFGVPDVDKNPYKNNEALAILIALVPIAAGAVFLWVVRNLAAGTPLSLPCFPRQSVKTEA